jgi:hypothetical protein
VAPGPWGAGPDKCYASDGSRSAQPDHADDFATADPAEPMVEGRACSIAESRLERAPLPTAQFAEDGHHRG